MAHGNVSPEGKAKVCFLPAPGLFQEGLCLVKPQRSVDMNHIQKIVFLHLSSCELIIYERMIFLEVKLFGFTTAIKCLEVLLKASRSYWEPVTNKQTNLRSVSSLSIIFQQNQQQTVSCCNFSSACRKQPCIRTIKHFKLKMTLKTFVPFGQQKGNGLLSKCLFMS